MVTAVNEQKGFGCSKFLAGLFLPLLLNSDDAGSMFLRNAELLHYSNRCEALKSNTVINNSDGCALDCSLNYEGTAMKGSVRSS
jgi:hypothetical protein